MQQNNQIQQQNLILLVDKVKGFTSFDALHQIKKRFGKKVGHAGTLDKFATGLLIVLCGKATKRQDEFMHADKSYVATFCLGSETDTLDPCGKVINTSDVRPTFDEIHAVLEQNFKGEIMQSPPQFSAIHKDGKRAYQMALKGEEFELEKRPITIYHYNIVSYNYPELIIKFDVSKGTYIRSIARDLGRLLGTYAHLTALRRTKIGKYSVENAVPSNQILECADLSKYIVTN